MELTLTYDLRAPEFGAGRTDLYAAALDQVAWADELGFDVVGLGAGYRPSEFETFGRKLDQRWRVMGEICEFLRLAWSGEAFEWQGRRCSWPQSSAITACST